MITLLISLPFQTTYSIRTDSEKLTQFLQLQYGMYIQKSAKTADFVIDATQHGDEYCVSFHGITKNTSHPELEIERILFKKREYDNRIIALHGAAVEYEGKAYIFLGSTKAGKTTLVSFLTTHGLRYITDDCIIIDRNNYEVYPCTTPVHLRCGGLAVLNQYNAAPPSYESNSLLEDERFVYTPYNCVSAPVPLEKIFFIHRTENENSITDMPMLQRMTELLKSPITNYTLSGEYIRVMAKLAKKSCSELYYCDMAFAEEMVRNE